MKINEMSSVADDFHQAIQLLSSALRQGHGFEYLDHDPDLNPIRNTQEFQRLVAAARTLQQK